MIQLFSPVTCSQGEKSLNVINISSSQVMEDLKDSTVSLRQKKNSVENSSNHENEKEVIP